MSQNYISTVFDALFFIIIGLVILVSSAFGSYDVLIESGLRTALADFLQSALWGFGSILLGVFLYLLTNNAKRIDFMNS